MVPAIFVAMINRPTRSITQRAAEIGPAASLLVSHSGKKHSTGVSIVVLWHLLSLDAPTVAVLWTIFTAIITRTRLLFATPVTMALTVWALYASDRLLDSRHLGSGREMDIPNTLEARHLFHHRNRTAFIVAIVMCTTALAALLPQLPTAAIRLYLAEGALMAGYFFLIHAAPKSICKSRLSLLYSRSPLPKELLVGPFFAAAIFIPTVSRKPELRLELLPCAILLAALCNLNCLYIYVWEHQTSYESHWATTYSIRNLIGLTWLFLAVSLLCFLSLPYLTSAAAGLQLYPLSCALSASLLLMIHKRRHYFSALTLRSVADATLLTPFFILPFLFRHKA